MFGSEHHSIKRGKINKVSSLQAMYIAEKPSLQHRNQSIRLDFKTQNKAWSLQEPVCSTAKEMKCIEKTNRYIDTSSCLKPCSGLIVTSFSKSHQKNDLRASFPIFQSYDNFKKLTSYPSFVAPGKHNT